MEFLFQKENFISVDCETYGSNYKTNKTNVPVSGLKNCEDKKSQIATSLHCLEV